MKASRWPETADPECLLFRRYRRERRRDTGNAKRAFLCRFLDAGNNETLRTLSGPASKKRQGTKSRESWALAGSECYGDFMLALISIVERDARTTRSCMSARTRGRESAVGISGGRSERIQRVDRRTGGCDGVERDRRGRGPSASGTGKPRRSQDVWVMTSRMLLGVGLPPRLAVAREDLDDDHASATARAWARQHTRGIRRDIRLLLRLGGGLGDTLRSARAVAMLSARLAGRKRARSGGCGGSP